MNKKLRISTSTNICNHIRWKEEYYSSEESIREIGKVGFDSVDLDMSFWSLSQDPMDA